MSKIKLVERLALARESFAYIEIDENNKSSFISNLKSLGFPPLIDEFTTRELSIDNLNTKRLYLGNLISIDCSTYSAINKKTKVLEEIKSLYI